MSTQAEWNAYAERIAGFWNLCANCAPDQSGKKLFRQYNFNRLLAGLDVVESPIDATEFCFTQNWRFDIHLSGSDAPQGFFTGGITEASIWYNVQIGSVLANPRMLMPLITLGIPFHPGDAVYDFMLQFVGLGVVKTCFFNKSGAPGLSDGGEVVEFP
jgi:hypothetical protein